MAWSCCWCCFCCFALGVVSMIVGWLARKRAVRMLRCRLEDPTPFDPRSAPSWTSTCPKTLRRLWSAPWILLGLGSTLLGVVGFEGLCVFLFEVLRVLVQGVWVSGFGTRGHLLFLSQKCCNGFCQLHRRPPRIRSGSPFGARSVVVIPGTVVVFG